MPITLLHRAWQTKSSGRTNTCLAALFLAMSIACAKRIDFGRAGEIHSPDQLLKLTDSAEHQILSINGEARLRVSSPKSAGTLNLLVAVAEPDSLHLESLNFFGKPQAILVSSAARFALLDQDRGKYYCGPASRENLSRFMPVAVPVRELVAMLLGRAPRIDSASPPKLEVKENGYLLTLADGARQQTLWIDPSSHRVTRSQLRGPQSYELAFEDFQSFGSTEYPRKTTLAVPADDTRVELKYRDVEINPPLKPSFFQLPPPPEIPAVALDETGNPRAGLCP